MLKLNSAAGKSVSCVLLLAAAAVGWKLAWNHWRDDVTLHPAYSISGDHIHLSPAPPDFIPGDIKSEVVRLGSLEDLPLLDPGITAKIAGAFELHPWVARTLRVVKRSGGVDVELEYRVPVALVQVTYNGERGTLPVDKQAVVLPIDAFRNQQGELAQFARGLPRIDGGESIPLNPDGAKWGDENIAGAAGIAAILKEQWQTLGLYRIAVLADDRQDDSSAAYIITARNGASVLWGGAPGHENAHEPKAAEKRQRLLQFAAGNSALNKQSPTTTLDVRTSNETALSKRSAPRL